MKKLSKILTPIGFLGILLIVLEAVIKFFHIPTYVQPTPSNIWNEGIQHIPLVISNAVVTFLEASLGFILGSLVAFFAASGMALAPKFKTLAMPYIIGLNTIPIIALAPIIIIWFGSGFLSKVLVSAFLCFFPLCLNLLKGLLSTPLDIRQLFGVYRASRFDLYRFYSLHHARGYLYAGLKINSSLCIVAAIVAELVASTQGIGFGILQAVNNLNTPMLWVYVISACLMALFLYSIILIIEYFYPS